MRLMVVAAVWVFTLLSILVLLPQPDGYLPHDVLLVLRVVAIIHLSAMGLIIHFRFANPKRTAYMRMFARWLSPDGHTPAPIIQEWVPLANIAKSMQLAVIAAEDPLFPRHYGFDWESIYAAVQYNRNTDLKRGASSISQQLAKNMFLWYKPLLPRKIVEAYLVLLMEAAWPKTRILELYLNVAQFGPTLFGVGAAAKHYFSLPAAALDDRQAALLSALLPNPRTEFNLGALDHKLKYRQVMILRSMKMLGPAYLETL